MAKYTITYKCEHDGEVNIVGPEKDRPGKREWLATQLCPDCKREQAQQDVATWTQARGLVPLVGTERQVEWANKLRKELLTEMERYVDPTSEDALQGYIARACKWAAKQSKAAWWIDRREHTGKTLLKKMVAELQVKDKEAARAQ